MRNGSFSGYLPSGKFTRSQKVYLREWDKTRRILEKKYELETIGFDPGFLMQDIISKQTVNLPTWLVRRMIEEH